MNPFLCVVDLDGRPLGADALAAAVPGLCAADGEVRLLFDGSWAAAWVPSPHFARPCVARRGGLVALGNVRLANRSELMRRLGEATPMAVTDLDLVTELFARRGASALRDLIGDFAFVVWDSHRNAVFAARDALGVKPLFYQRTGRRLLMASHPECLEQGEYDRSFIARYLTGDPSGRHATIFKSLARLPGGSWLVAEGNRVTIERYWTPAEFAPARERCVEEATAEMRELLAAAVAAQLDDGVGAWSQLSGGLDSSAIVAMASWLAERGRVSQPLRGTVTVVDSLSDGDETRYSDAVVARYRLPNERVVDYWAWQSDQLGPPVSAEPRYFLPFFARDREMCRVVREGGGRVLLSGYGSDQYLSGQFDFIADLVAERRLGEAVAQLVDLAVTTRRSFWQLGLAHAVRPLLAARAGSLPLPEPPDWLVPGLSDEAGMVGQHVVAADRAAAGIFAGQVAREVASAELLIDRGLHEEGLEMRYPFLYRPLVEFGLRLPVGLRVRPHRQKWVLREALRDLLPAEVRERTGKGGIGGRFIWSLEREAPLLRRLIADSHLADLGCVRRDALASGFEAVRRGQVRNITPLFITLALETWLAIRSGWWSRHASVSPAARVPSSADQPPTMERHHEKAALH